MAYYKMSRNVLKRIFVAQTNHIINGSKVTRTSDLVVDFVMVAITVFSRMLWIKNDTTNTFGLSKVAHSLK